MLRRRLFGPSLRLRVDLHGVSVFGPGDQRTLIRWEWIEGIEADEAVEVRSASDALRLPAGAFGLSPAVLAERLQAARSLERRPEVIEELALSRSRP